MKLFHPLLVSVLVHILISSVNIKDNCFSHRNIAGSFLYYPFLCDASRKNEDRCGNWYSGHAVPSLAVCEGETDVNELLSFG